MKMEWWVSVIFLAIQVILIQFMLETYQEGELNQLLYYTAAAGILFVIAWITFTFFKRMEDTPD